MSLVVDDFFEFEWAIVKSGSPTHLLLEVKVRWGPCLGPESHSWGSGLGVLATLLLFGLLVQQCVNMRAYKWPVSNLCLYKPDRDVLLVRNN